MRPTQLQLPVGLLTLLVEHYTSVAEVIGSNPAQAYQNRRNLQCCLACACVYSHTESLWLSSRATEHGIRRSADRFLVSAQSFSSSHARDKMKKHLSLFLYRAQNLTIFLFLLTKHDVNDIADPSSLQDAYHAPTSEWALPTTDSPWLSWSDSHGDSEFFLSHARDKTKKKISFFISLVGSKSNHLSYSICYPVDIFQISQKVYA